MKLALPGRLQPSDFRDVVLYSRRSILARGMALGLAGSTLAACAVVEGEFRWFQKLTVTLETPNGTKTGIEVIESKAEFYKEGTYFGTAGKFEITGEAGVVEVLPGKYLFILLRGFDSGIAEAMFVPKSPPLENSTVAKARRYAILESFGKTTRIAELPPSLYPVCVTFQDVFDPATLVVVDLENLGQYFGPGVTLRSVELTVSPRENIPDEIQALLPWLVPDASKRGRIIPTNKVHSIEMTSAELIDFGDFVTFDRWRRG